MTTIGAACPQCGSWITFNFSRNQYWCLKCRVWWERKDVEKPRIFVPDEQVENPVDMDTVRQFPVRPCYPVKRRDEWRKG